MLNSRLSHVIDMVRQQSARVGNSPPRIADAIIAEAFPDTHEASVREGADKMLRVGLIDWITPLLRTQTAHDADFSDIEPSFRPLASKLKKFAYHVPSRSEEVSVPDLIASPGLLDEARRYMRQKSDECRVEADVLDELHAAVTASK